MKNKEKEEADKVVVVDSRPYPWYSSFVSKLDLTIPKGNDVKDFERYSLRVGLYILLIQGARPEFLYKAELGNVVQVTYPGTNQTWVAFSYSGKSDKSHHMLDEECRINVFDPYIVKREQVVKEHFSNEVLFSIPSKAPLFFNSKGEFWKNNVNQKASAVFLKDTGLDFKKEKVACYKFRIASTTVATYLKFKGITSNDFVDATVSLRGHQSKTSERCYDKWTPYHDGIQGWEQLRKSEEIYVDNDVNFFKVQAYVTPEDEDYEAAKSDELIGDNVASVNTDAEPMELDVAANDEQIPSVSHHRKKTKRKANEELVAEQNVTRDASDIISSVNFPFIETKFDPSQVPDFNSLKDGNVYREDMMDCIFSLISYHKHYWTCINREFVRDFLRRIPSLSEKYTTDRCGKKVPTLTDTMVKRILSRFELMRIIGGIFIVLKSKEIKPKKFARDPRSYTNVVVQGLAELEIQGELRADEHLARAAKMISRLGYYTYEQLEQLRNDYPDYYDLQSRF